MAAPVFAQQFDSMTIQLVNFFGTCGVLIVFILLHKWVAHIVKTPAYMVVAILLTTTGTILLGIPYQNQSIPLQLGLVGNVLCSIGSGLILTLIGEGYARITDITIQCVLTLSAIAGAFLLFLTFLPFSRTGALIYDAVFPIVSVICLGWVLLSKPVEDTTGRSEKPAFRPARIATGVLLEKPALSNLLVYIGVLSVPLTFLRTTLVQAAGPLEFNDWASLYAVTFLLISVVILLEILFKKLNFSIISVTIVILVTIDLLLFSFFEIDTLVLYALINTGYALFVASFYCFLGSFILSSDQPPFRIFAFGNAANMIGLMVGWALGQLFGGSMASRVSEVIVLVILYAVFLTGVLALPAVRKNFFIKEKKKVEPVAKRIGIIEEIQVRCREISEESALSPREEEILVLLARGKSLPLIAEELTLSQNTVKTHVGHLYGKLRLHSRDQLMQMIEGER
jgi:DNA-binding CsgD family transcriptional regulator